MTTKQPVLCRTKTTLLLFTCKVRSLIGTIISVGLTKCISCTTSSRSAGNDRGPKVGAGGDNFPLLLITSVVEGLPLIGLFSGEGVDLLINSLASLCWNTGVMCFLGTLSLKQSPSAIISLRMCLRAVADSSRAVFSLRFSCSKSSKRVCSMYRSFSLLEDAVSTRCSLHTAECLSNSTSLFGRLELLVSWESCHKLPANGIHWKDAEYWLSSPSSPVLGKSTIYKFRVMGSPRLPRMAAKATLISNESSPGPSCSSRTESSCRLV